MEGHSTSSFDSGKVTAGVGNGGSGGGASSFLANLPSRGLFTSTILSCNPGGMRVYICEHDTSPPEDQLVKTDQQNILIRSLTLKNQRGDGSSKDGKSVAAGQSSRKRAAERALDNRAKRAVTSAQAVSQQEGSKPQIPQRDLQNLTVERIRALLREKGLSQRGRKDELIARLKGATAE